MIYLPGKCYLEILRHCEKELPNEACGLAGGIVEGDNKYIKKIYLLTNIDASSCHFTMDIKEQFAVIKDIRAMGYKLVGNFHSHPSAPARLSMEDIRLAYDFKTTYMVLSLMDREHPVLNAFNIDRDRNVIEEEMEVFKL